MRCLNYFSESIKFQIKLKMVHMIFFCEMVQLKSTLVHLLNSSYVFLKEKISVKLKTFYKLIIVSQ